MEKCWFVLKQEHFPPPEIPDSGIGIAKGAISLGHIIPDANNLDYVINRNKGIDFTPSVPIYHTKYVGLDWKRNTSREAEGAMEAAVPLSPAVPASAQQNAKAAFSQTEKNHKEFDTLDRYIIQVDRKFIRKILADEEVEEHIQRTKGKLCGSWSVFMITGIMVAKGAKGEFGESKTFEAKSSTKL